MDEGNKRETAIEIDAEPPQKKQQTSISAYFGLPKTKKIAEPKANKKAKSGSGSQTLQVATAEKWKITSLAKYGAENCLVADVDQESKLVKSLRCSICSKYENRITSVKGFQETWCHEGSKRLQHASALENAEGKAHCVSFFSFYNTCC